MDSYFIDNAFDGYIMTNENSTRKDAFIAGIRLTERQVKKETLENIKKIFSEKSIFDGVQEANKQLEEMNKCGLSLKAE